MAKHVRSRSTPKSPRSRRRVVEALIGVPVALLALITTAWAVDTEVVGGDVVRNVEVTGHPVGGLGEDALAERLTVLSAELAETPVRIVTPETTYETTAGALGIALDAEATAAAALEAGRGFALARPFRWLASPFAPHRLDAAVEVNRDAALATLAEVEGEDRRAPVEPVLAFAEGNLGVTPGVPGSGIDLDTVLDQAVAAAARGDAPIVVEVTPVVLPPATPDEAIQAVVDEANGLTAAPITVTVGEQSADLPPETVRGWVRAHPAGDGTFDLVIDGVQAAADLEALLPEAGTAPVNASFTLVEGRPQIVPSQPGIGCCDENAGNLVLEALRAGAATVDIPAVETQPAFTTADAEAYGIVEQVGGTHAWPVSRESDAPPGFTTYHACCQSRVTNIHRIADLARGHVIAPGDSFSVNDRIGRRTRENGFVAAGAIRNGQHVDEVGGGVSQFATTLFNAAYFAGLDIPVYQAHSEYFSRYPRGREATMGFPNPDLVIENNTPYGILIWTSYTDTSLTITLYSTPFATGEQTGIREGRSGNCDVVTTTRTRTYVDGREPTTDTFSATYRPGEGQFC